MLVMSDGEGLSRTNKLDLRRGNEEQMKTKLAART